MCCCFVIYYGMECICIPPYCDGCTLSSKMLMAIEIVKQYRWNNHIIISRFNTSAEHTVLTYCRNTWVIIRSAHGVPATRAGMPTARRASTKKILSPVQLAPPASKTSTMLAWKTMQETKKLLRDWSNQRRHTHIHDIYTYNFFARG